MSALKTLLMQSTHYFAGRVFLMVAGLISFPILTRIFSVSDYGVLGLITTTISIVVAVTKIGFPSAITRFYQEYKFKNKLNEYYSTIFYSAFIVALVVTVFFMVFFRFIPSRFIDGNYVAIFSLAAILILTKSVSDILTSFLRAEQKTKLYNLVLILRRYISLALGVFFVFFFFKGLYGFYVGQIVASVILLSILLFISREKIKIGIPYISLSGLKEFVKLGFPLIWAELGHLILSYADRYLIQLYLGSISLGLYTAGYNLTTHVTQAIIYPINYAMAPIYMDILVNKGELQTKRFLTKLFTYFMLIMLPCVFGFIAVSKNLIGFLASEKYADAYPIIPYVIVGQAVYACTIILNSGLFIGKKTHIMTWVMLITCLLNVGLNVIMIPVYGILGAAQATLISYIIYAILLTYCSMKEFSFSIEYKRLTLYICSSLVMLLVLEQIDIANNIGALFSKIGIGIVLYSFMIFFFDGELRHKSIEFVKTFR